MKIDNGVIPMRIDLIKPIFTTFFKKHFMMDVIVEEVEAINPLFTVSTYEGRLKKHLLIIYVNARKGSLPILNIYDYDDDGKNLLMTMQHANKSSDHYTKVRDIFERINSQLGIFKESKFVAEENVLKYFTAYRVNNVNDFNKLCGNLIAEFKSGFGRSYIKPDFSFTIYNEELYLDFRYIYSIQLTERVISSHPQLLANNQTYYEDIEKELYHTSRKSLINKVRQDLKVVLDPQDVLDEDLIRYVNLLEMQKI